MGYWRQQFSWASVSLRHESPADFSASKWQKDKQRVSPWYLAYRAAISLLCFAVLISNGALTDKRNFWFIFLTNLGFLSLTLYSMLALAVVIEKLFHERNGNFEGEMTRLTRISWVLSNIVTLVSIVVTVVYWIALYKPEKGLSAMNFFVHASNMIITTVDIFVSAKPSRILHFYQPAIAVFCYVSFSALYWVAGGTNHKGETFIYPILNWENASNTVIFVVLGLIAVPLLHTAIFCLHYLRDSLHRCFVGKKEQPPGLGVSYDNKAFDI